MVDQLLDFGDDHRGTDAEVYAPGWRIRRREQRRKVWTAVGLVVCAAIALTALLNLH